MADRIFPNNINVDMGSKIQFSGIDYENVKKLMNNNFRAAQSSEQEIQDLLRELQENEDMNTEEMGADMGKLDSDMGNFDMDMDNMDTDMDNMDTDMDNMDTDMDNMDTDIEDMDTDMDNVGTDMDNYDLSKPLVASTNKIKRIAFTHPSQISAEAIERAQAAGDEKLVKTILAARKENRKRIASAIESRIASEQKLEIRKAHRNSIIKLAEENSSFNPIDFDIFDLEALEQLKSQNPELIPDTYMEQRRQEETMKNPIDTEMSTDGMKMSFTSPTKFTKAQRESFNKIAMSLGMPKSYVEAMCAPVIPNDVKKLSKEIKEVYSSNVSDKVKTSVIKSLIKEASLSPDSKREFIDYWNNVLGYQDKDFWPLVAADYEDGKKVN
jgi:hypothetical protein